MYENNVLRKRRIMTTRIRENCDSLFVRFCIFEETVHQRKFGLRSCFGMDTFIIIGLGKELH